MHIRPFEIVLIGVFILSAIIAVVYVRLYSGDSEKDKPYGESVVIWGTLDRGIIENYIGTLENSDEGLTAVQYRQIDAYNFEEVFVNAVAEGRSPDMIILPHEMLLTFRPKLRAIAYEMIPERTFRDTYIDGAEIFMLSDGVYGIPFAVDPLVMYWNRDIFSSSGIATPPKTWETIVSQTTQAVLRTDEQHTLTQSAVAFGGYENVAHAKETLAMLFLQAGSPIVKESTMGYEIVLNENVSSGLTPGSAVLSFYTQFSLPTKELYSWNRSKALDRIEFLNGSLALYFGMGSERRMIEKQNPNLNFDIASVPQGAGVTVLRNYGDFYAFAIPRQSRNFDGAYAVASILSSQSSVAKLTDGYGFVPVRRALFEGATHDPLTAVTYQSALIARGWLDPDPVGSSRVFENLIDEVVADITHMNSILNNAIYKLESLF